MDMLKSRDLNEISNEKVLDNNLHEIRRPCFSKDVLDCCLHCLHEILSSPKSWILVCGERDEHLSRRLRIH